MIILDWNTLSWDGWGLMSWNQWASLQFDMGWPVVGDVSTGVVASIFIPGAVAAQIQT